MQAKLQDLIAFHLTGRRRSGSGLGPIDASHRPALLAGYTDLTSLRYDFPLVLNQIGPPERAVLSLSALVDEAVASIAEEAGRDRIARHGYRLEREVRKELSVRGSGDFASIWNEAAGRLAAEGDENVAGSAGTLWTAFRAAGDIVDVGVDLPAHLVRHAWERTQATKADAFRDRAERLLFKLRNILEAEAAGSAVGRAPDRLMAAVGSSFARSFDFNAMSQLLTQSKPNFSLSDRRRERIEGLIEVLEQQRFYPLEAGGPAVYQFAFTHCREALDAYRERRDEAAELLKALAIAELETRGDYREAVHDVLFEGYSRNGLAAAEASQLPDYLVCTDTAHLDAEETARLVEMLASGLRVKVLVRTDDLLEPSEMAEGNIKLGLRTRQLVQTAIGSSDVFVMQASASQAYQKRETLMKGLAYEGPALFSVFSGASGHTGDAPAYLVAAAAAESRAFPSLDYDPAAGATWATRFRVEDNPAAEEDWPVYSFSYEDGSVQARSEQVAFTLADFMAMDERFSDGFAVVAKEDWSDGMESVPEALADPVQGIPDAVPCITMIDRDRKLQRAVVSNRVLTEARRCLTMWHSLQELGGIHNSHAERLLAAERSSIAVPVITEVPAVETPRKAEAIEPVDEPVAAAAPEGPSVNGDDPYIETARCTTCNECTNLNNRMFAYNDEKQAYIADPDAGTFRQLVEAAEGCQVSIIHPGKPRNPKEPGLEDLIKRAAEFN